MSARGIQLQIFNGDSNRNTILSNEAVVFTVESANWYDTSSLINKIHYNDQTGCSITVTEDTENIFYISCTVVLNSSASSSIPIFKLQITDENNVEFISFSMSGSKKTGSISSSFLAVLPYLPNGLERKYYVSLINSSDTDCSYGKRIFIMANLCIASLPY